MKLATMFGFVSLLVTISNAQVYSITDLGQLSPTAINTWGQIVGNYNGQAYIWTFGHGSALGLLPGGTFSMAASINDLGTVTGTADGSGVVLSTEAGVESLQCSDLTQPFIWTPRKGMRGLGTVETAVGFLFACELPFYASGINITNEIVGYDEEAVTYQYGFSWTQGAGIASFGTSWPPTLANAVNSQGEIVGQSSIFLWDAGHAVSWSNLGTAMADLGTLAGPDPNYDYGSAANGVNDLGQVVGGATLGISERGDSLWPGWSEPFHAVLWAPDGQIQDLGALPGNTLSIAQKINFFGLVIGSSGNSQIVGTDGQPGGLVQVVGRPFIWCKKSGMRDLNSVIPGNSGWVLKTATDINLWGQIVGEGTLNGEAHGFLLTPKFF
jgi:uncharacterized membrane protein